MLFDSLGRHIQVFGDCRVTFTVKAPTQKDFAAQRRQVAQRTGKTFDFQPAGNDLVRQRLTAFDALFQFTRDPSCRPVVIGNQIGCNPVREGINTGYIMRAAILNATQHGFLRNVLGQFILLAARQGIPVNGGENGGPIVTRIPFTARRRRQEGRIKRSLSHNAPANLAI